MTALGQIIAGFSSITGIMMLAMPLGVLVHNFGLYELYSRRKKKVIEIFSQFRDEHFLYGEVDEKELEANPNLYLLL